MNIQLNRNWVQTLVVSLPEYAEDLGSQIQTAMTEEILDDIDAHSCALGAAIAAGNGELAFEIAMSDALRGNDIREEIAKAVIDLTIDNPTALVNPTLYKLAIAYVLNKNVQASLLVEKLDQEGIETSKLDAAQRIAKLIPAISKCII